MFDAGLATFGWQTYAWSAGQWDARAQIQQYRNDQFVDGVGVDFDRATADDFGQWSIQVGDFPGPDPNAATASGVSTQLSQSSMRSALLLSRWL